MKTGGWTVQLLASSHMNEETQQVKGILKGETKS